MLFRSVSQSRYNLRGKLIDSTLSAGAGTKAVRWNSSTGEFTYADTTVGGGGLTIGTTTIANSATGSILYDSSGILSRNADLYWDVSNKRLGIGTSTPNASALLDVTSTTRGAVLPRMNTTQMNAISSPVAGLMVYNSDSASYVFYNGSVWLKMGSGSGGVSTPTLQQVITAGSTLTTDNTIGGGGNTLNINNLWGLYIEAGNGRWIS